MKLRVISARPRAALAQTQKDRRDLGRVRRGGSEQHPNRLLGEIIDQLPSELGGNPVLVESNERIRQKEILHLNRIGPIAPRLKIRAFKNHFLNTLQRSGRIGKVCSAIFRRKFDTSRTASSARASWTLCSIKPRAPSGARGSLGRALAPSRCRAGGSLRRTRPRAARPCEVLLLDRDPRVPDAAEVIEDELVERVSALPVDRRGGFGGHGVPFR